MATVSILKKERTISRRLFSLSYNSCIEKLSKGEIHEIRVILTILDEKAKQMIDIEEKFKNAIFSLDLSEEETLKELDLESFIQRETEYILLKARCENLLGTESDEILEFGNARSTSNNKSLTEGLHDDIIEQVGDDNGYFLSQHPVIEEASLTTRMRPVFDASAKDDERRYLYTSLEPIVNSLKILPKHLHDCRMCEYGVTADIKGRFSQMKYLKFLWRANEDPRELIAAPDLPWWGGWCKRFFRMLKEILRRLLEKLGSGLGVVLMMTPEKRSLWPLGVVGNSEAKTVYA